MALIQTNLNLWSINNRKLILEKLLVEEAELVIEGKDDMKLCIYGKHIELNRPASKFYSTGILPEHRRKFYNVLKLLREHGILIHIIRRGMLEEVDSYGQA